MTMSGKIWKYKNVQSNCGVNRRAFFSSFLSILLYLFFLDSVTWCSWRDSAHMVCIIMKAYSYVD